MIMRVSGRADGCVPNGLGIPLSRFGGRRLSACERLLLYAEQKALDLCPCRNPSCSAHCAFGVEKDAWLRDPSAPGCYIARASLDHLITKKCKLCVWRYRKGSKERMDGADGPPLHDPSSQTEPASLEVQPTRGQARSNEQPAMTARVKIVNGMLMHPRHLREDL